MNMVATKKITLAEIIKEYNKAKKKCFTASDFIALEDRFREIYGEEAPLYFMYPREDEGFEDILKFFSKKIRLNDNDIKICTGIRFTFSFAMCHKVYDSRVRVEILNTYAFENFKTNEINWKSLSINISKLRNTALKQTYVVWN